MKPLHERNSPAHGLPKIVFFGLFSAPPQNQLACGRYYDPSVLFGRGEMSEHFIEALGSRFRRSTCGRCGEPVEWLGEAIRVDCVEGRFEILHVCLPCVRVCDAQAGRGEEAQAA